MYGWRTLLTISRTLNLIIYPTFHLTFRVNVVRVRVLSPPHTTPATRRSVVAARRIINPVRIIVRPLFRIRERTVRHAHHLHFR